VDFGGGALVSAAPATTDVFVVKFDPSGNHIWSKRFGDPDDQRSSWIGVDAAGNAVIAGSFQDSIDFGGGALMCAGAFDAFVAKLDADGNYVWSKRFGDWYHDVISAGAIDGSGNLIFAGGFWETIDFGGGPIGGAIGSYKFLSKLDPAGNHVWSKTSPVELTAVAADVPGNVFVTGALSGTVSLGGAPLTGAGWSDVFVAKFAP
jgi:hypothetical protein